MNGMALCAGAGGLELGLHLALGDAYRTVVGVEWEASAASVLVARQQDGALPPFPIWDSVATFDGRPWRGVVDIVSGGFPCQPFSVAGKRGGDADERHLWPHIARIIGECEPPLVFLENVPGLLNTPLANGSGYAYEMVEDDLHELGYIVASGLFTAAEVGAPHQRERLFILAHRTGATGGDAESFGVGRATAGPRSNSPRMADAGDGQLSEPWRGAHGRNGAGPAGADDVDDALGQRGRGGNGGREDAEDAHSPGEGLPTFPPGPGERAAWQRILAVRPDLAPALSINEEWELGYRFPLAQAAPQSPLHGVADGVSAGLDLSRAARLRLTGNGVVPAQAALAFRTLWKEMRG